MTKPKPRSPARDAELFDRLVTDIRRIGVLGNNGQRYIRYADLVVWLRAL